MKRILAILPLLIVFALAGDIENIQKDIRFLASPACSGRNVANGGIFMAQNYITGELQKVGVQTQCQPVTYKLNMILETPVCVINGDTLRPGYDFIPHPYSASVDRSFFSADIDFIDSAKLAEVQEKNNLSSLSSARRYLIKKSKRKDNNKLLFFNGGYPLISNQSNQYRRAVLQVNDNILNETPQNVYMFNSTEYKKVTTNNIIAKIEGTAIHDTAICFSAHYDHMGSLGNIYYPGANDNASGVAVLMSLARYFAENPPKMTLIFCFFTGEEQGLKGSWAYVKDPVYPLKNTLITINLDMVGSGVDGYGIVGGNDQPTDVSIFEDIREEMDLGDLKLRNNAPNSDHFPFTAKDVPALFFYASGGEQPYHHPDDVPETLDWKTIENTVEMMKEYVLRMIND